MRNVVRTLAFVALAALLSLSACKKEPAAGGAPEPGKQSAEASETTPAAPDEATPKKPAPTVADKTAPVEATPKKPAPTVADKTAPVAIVPVAKDVALYGAIKSLDELKTVISDVEGRFSQAPVASSMMTMALQMGLELKSLAWLDGARPIHVVLLNPKAYVMPAVIAVPVTSMDALEAALPDRKKKDDRGNALSYATQGQELFFNPMSGSRVAVTMLPGLFADHKATVEELTAKAPTKTVEISFPVDNLNRIYADEIALAEAQTQKLADMPMDIPFPGLGEVLKKEYDLFFQGVREMVRMDVTLEVIDGSVVGTANATVLPDGAVTKLIAASLGRKATFADYLPTTTWFGMAYNADPKGYEDWNELGLDFMVSIFELNEQKAAQLRTLYNDCMALSTGDGAAGFYRDGSFGFAFDAVMGVTDAPKARAQYNALFELLWHEGVTFLKKTLEAEGETIPAELDLSSFDKLMATVGPIANAVGVDFSLKTEDYKNSTIDYITVKVDYDKFPNLDNVTRGQLRQALGERFQFTLGYAPGFIYESFGPNALARTKKAIDGHKPFARNPIFAETRKAIEAGESVFFVDAVQGAKALMAIPEFAEYKPVVDALSSTGLFSWQGRSSAPNQLEMSVVVPLQPLVDLNQAFTAPAPVPSQTPVQNVP